MIGNLACRSEQTDNEAVQQTDLRTRRTPAHLAFAYHMNRLVIGEPVPLFQGSSTRKSTMKLTTESSQNLLFEISIQGASLRDIRPSRARGSRKNADYRRISIIGQRFDENSTNTGTGNCFET
jgi:hypothetical protein